MSRPKLLSGLQYRGLQKLGDVYCPGDSEYPRFSTLGCGEHADTMLEVMPAQDLGDLKMLLTIFGILPRFSVRMLVTMIEGISGLPGPIGAILRLMRFGMKGLSISLYWSGLKGEAFAGKTPLQILGYEVSVYTADLDGPGAKIGSSAQT
ncbi:MAG: hypothetical protein IT285_06180 [Bdellovibrionales bacterium]|nr:hypothetical protein [Bdellovibrionales bacterium]